MKIAMMPVRPSSSPNEPRMKSLLAAKSISQERPWPRPEPVTPPEPSAISDWPICSVEPGGGLGAKAAIGSSQASMRVLTWLAVEATATAPPTDISRPKTIQLVRSVATYSITTKRPKYRKDEPRSFSKIRISRLSSQITMIGPRSRPRGR